MSTKDEFRDANQKTPMQNHMVEPPKYILLVEDEEIGAFVAISLLKQFNCKIDHAVNGSEALELAKKNKYDLIFMDLGLPVMDGVEVTKQIRLYEHGVTKTSPVPIIAITANEDPNKKLECLEAGINNVLAKPLTKENVQDVFHTFIINRPQQAMVDTAANFTAVSGKVIDIAKLVDLIEKNPEYAKIKTLIDQLANEFPNEIEQLQRAYATDNHQVIRHIALRLAGKSTYCHMERLRAAAKQLVECKDPSNRSLFDLMYQELLHEIELVQQEYNQLKEKGIL